MIPSITDRCAEIKRSVGPNWQSLAERHGFDSDRIAGVHGPCCIGGCGGTDRARFFPDGGYLCNQCGTRGDFIEAIKDIHGWTIGDTVTALEEELGIIPTVEQTDELRKQFVAFGTSTPAAQQRVRDNLQMLVDAKAGLTVEAMLATGAEVVTWPVSNTYGQTCIAFRAEMRPGETTGYILRRADGKEFPPSGRLQARKTHMLRGSADGWVIPGGFERLAKATVVWRVEGVPDALALFPMLPEDHAVVSNICGAKSCPDNRGIFAGKTLYSLGDADKPGKIGAERFASKVKGIADTVKVVELPYEIVPDHGPDLRDWIVGGGTFAQLLEIAESSPEFTKPTKSEKRQHRSESFDGMASRQPVDPWVDILEDQGRTEVANSRRFLARHRNIVRFCHVWNKWLIWCADHWQVDDSGAVLRLGKEVADSIWMEAANFKTDDVVKFAVDSSKSSKIASFLKLAAAEVPVDISELDANPWLLNCANGTIDLRTGELRPHRQEDSLTKICPTRFNPDASSHHFDRFMESIFEDAAVIDFLRRLMGYCLTGSVSEQILPVFWGVGSNGKSTFLNALQHAYGIDYSGAAPPSLLMEKRQESHPTELANLFGKRLVIAAETNQGARLAESVVKQLTGGDVISARRMREDFWTFNPTHKLLLCTNHKPSVRGTDHAIWRRLVLIPFCRTFWNPAKGETGPVELQQDKGLADKLKAEAEGILAWAVRGCLEWQRDGLQIPATVRAATDEYRSESDVVGQFISECCLTGQAYRVRFSDLFEALQEWCADNGNNAPSKKFVGKYLVDHDYPDRQSGVRWYLGIALKEVGSGDYDEALSEAMASF